jgi:hypothetical protein
MSQNPSGCEIRKKASIPTIWKAIKREACGILILLGNFLDETHAPHLDDTIGPFFESLM